MIFEPQTILFVSGLLVFTSIVASILSDRIGIPTLLVFLSVGMLAGTDGPGGIHFDSSWTANFVGAIALSYILFSGGLDTNWRIIRPVLARGVLLSTIGVVVTASVTALFAWAILEFPPLVAALIGAIISSTDAAAVFSLLRGRGTGLKGELKPLLELESGSNDPIAIFLTIGITKLLTLPDFTLSTLAFSFLLNVAVGIAVGLLSGKLAALLINSLKLEYEGLYPVLSISLVMLTFGASELLGGNGFLSVYLCGILLNGSSFVHKRNVVRFHGGLAWLMQIVMFVVLGLLVYPSSLVEVAPAGLLIAAALMFVARPAAVFLCLIGKKFSLREKLFVSWTGLRGAVPIVLATFPLLAGFEQSILIFDIVFFTVLISVAAQGTLLMPVARLLKVDEPMASPPLFSLEIERKGKAQGETLEVEILPNMGACGKKVTDLQLPAEVLILLIGRGESSVVPKGNTVLKPYDTLLLLGPSDKLEEASDAVLSPVKRPIKMSEEIDPLTILPYSTDKRFLSHQVVLVGHGTIGSRVREHLSRLNVPCVAVDSNLDIIDKLRKLSIPSIWGDASEVEVLVQAHLMKASALIIAIPDISRTRKIIDTARKINPGISIIIRVDHEVDASVLRSEEFGIVVLNAEEFAAGLTRRLLETIRLSESQKESSDCQNPNSNNNTAI